MPTVASSEELREHITGTYFSLGIGMAVLGYALPVLLVVGGLILEPDAGIRPSMSDYYNNEVLRNVFVGSLILIGGFLFLYQGFSTAEEVAFDLAGVFAVGTALFPTGQRAHAVFAIAFFACIAYVCLFRAGDTLHLLPEKLHERYAKEYRVIGTLMIALPLFALLLGRLFGSSTVVLGVEAAAVWVFGTYWAVKSREFSHSHADRRAAAGELVAVAEPPAARAEPGGPAKRMREAVGAAVGSRCVVEREEARERILRGSDALENEP